MVGNKTPVVHPRTADFGNLVKMAKKERSPLPNFPAIVKHPLPPTTSPSS